MTSKEILSRAASFIEKKGLARGTALDKSGAFCFAAALVEAARLNDKISEKEKKKREEVYVNARNFLCGHMGIASSYDALVAWNDDSFVTKKGELRYKHTPADALREIRETIAKVENPTV